MKARFVGLGAVLIGAACVFAWQPVKEEAVRSDEARSGMRSPGLDGPKLLAEMCGTFELKMTITPRPGAEAIVMMATATRAMEVGGRFMVERVEAKEPMPFSSVSYMGYNPDGREGPRFEVVRMSSSSKCLMPERGTYDAARKTFTLTGEHEMEGMTGRMRNEINVSDMDHQVVETTLAYEGYSGAMKGAKVPEYHAMTMEYTRKK
jgi:hypothetical protein